MNAFRVGFVEGVMPDKWKRMWAERSRRPLDMRLIDSSAQQELIASAEVDMALVRGLTKGDGLHLIPLYDEQPAIVVGQDHPAAAYDELPVGDLADDLDVRAAYPEISVREAFATVAAGTGHLVVPRSVARVNQRKDVAVIHAVDEPVTSIGLAWLAEHDDPDIETFIGIVRGRSVRSSR